MNRKPLLTTSLLVIVGFLTVCPVVMLAIGSFSAGFGRFDRFTWIKYIEAYSDPEFLTVLWNTLVFTTGSALVTTALALFLAYMNTRTNIPFKFL
ncbi:hypothetical protein [Desulfatirhabdium butyrativorans]|uniref:hypothetical protein n=1 Tax=Desulfatirhabdium butyrativorans TaxID=340467 RepID=UPI000425F399|nr:hypothetical protein [Desulfatirhabdium butyrativorans]